MTDVDIKKIKKQLLKLKLELQAMEEELKEAGETVVLDQTRMGRLSRMDAMQVQQMALETARRRQQQLVKIDGALQRIKSDEYGYCYICDEEISASRLAIDPSSTRCMGCAEK